MSTPQKSRIRGLTRFVYSSVTDVLVLSVTDVFVSRRGVAGISLLVGGIGIMNVMLAVINERIREIGVRKAIGARGHDIFIQFLAESVVISLVGGLIGMAVSVGFVELLRTGIQEENFRIVLSFPAMLFGFAFSATIGVISGIYPAMKAASMNIIDALRYE